MAGFGAKFGRIVREKRGIEGLSQEELAAQAGVTKARISDLENGKINNPQAKTVDALCVALNIQRDERATCHELTGPTLPPLLLENLALRFGHGNPSATEGELVAFLNEQAVAFAAMQKRLAAIDAADSAVFGLIAEASTALGQGDFREADVKLAAAEETQLVSTTVPALEAQHRLRFERGNAALLAGDVASAAAHWEAAANYFHYVDAQLEADHRFEFSILLREYAYRYRNAEALYAAEAALRINLVLWTKEGYLADWCKVQNALGGVYWRLSQFDEPSKFHAHLQAAKNAYSEVRQSTGPQAEPYFYAISGGNLANIYSDPSLGNCSEESTSNLKTALELLKSAASTVDRGQFPTDWGIFHHNLGCTYVKLFDAQVDKAARVDLIDQAVAHLEWSFEVRDPDDALQYWVASCRSLGEALITGAPFRDRVQGLATLQRAAGVIAEALSKISEADHPNQWGGLKEQEARLSEDIVKPRQVPLRSPLGRALRGNNMNCEHSSALRSVRWRHWPSR